MLFLITPLIEGSDEIDFVVTVEANTSQQALDYAIANSLVSSDQEVKVVSPTIHNACMHKIKKV